jgi:hypothetical protein
MADLTFDVIGSTEQLTLTDYTLVIAGFTGRNQAEVQHHIDELVAIGVPAPDTVPSFYLLDSSLATSAAEVTVDGDNTSGEVEPVLIRHGGRLYLSVGSDHTDRDIERDSIAKSKAACPKPVASSVFALPEKAEDFDWDSVTATSTVDGKQYQTGTLKSLRLPTDVLALYTENSGNVDGDVLLFGGTLPLLGGEFIPGTEWRIALGLPNSIELAHAYNSRIA